MLCMLYMHKEGDQRVKVSMRAATMYMGPIGINVTHDASYTQLEKGVLLQVACDVCPNQDPKQDHFMITCHT